MNLQPSLKGELISLRKLEEADFEPLFDVASDPLIWAQHPIPNRYLRDVFYETYFKSAIESKGSLIITNIQSQKIIGCSRFYDYLPQNRSIVIGYTFLGKNFWGHTYNRELKILMLSHAFKFVDKVFFYIGENNIRSQKAIQKIGAKFLKKSARTSNINSKSEFIYQITHPECHILDPKLMDFST